MFIEGNEARAQKLIKRYSGFHDIICIQGYVYPVSGENKKSLDDYCDEHGVTDIDFLSIDIDGLDLNIFENLRRRPTVVTLEGGFSWHPQMNARVPDEVAAQNLQQPLAVVIESVQARGYQPICFNQNLYAVEQNFAGRFSGYQQDAESLWLDAYYSQSDAFRQIVHRIRKTNPLIREYEAPNRTKFTLDL